MGYRIAEVCSGRDLKRFVRFPDILYRDCPQYVPALHSDQYKSLTKASSLSYCSHKMWMVTDCNDKVVGRICAMVNPRYNARYGTRRARFGWFDTVNDIEVAGMLLDAAEKWAVEQGMNEIHGPLYYNTSGKQGMLVEGFGNIPPFNCIYNYPYYRELVEGMGYVKECDWVQYKLPVDQNVPEKTAQISEMLSLRYGLHIGNIDRLKKDKDKVRDFFRVYNDSFAGSVYNFIPFTEEEIEEELDSVMPFLSDKTSCIVLDGNEDVVAFGITFPSISAALRKSGGRLFPFGWLHLSRALRNYETLDLMLNGVAPGWRDKGVSSVYFCNIIDKIRRVGGKWAITNPQIEDNTAVNLWNSYQKELYMRRRCYVKSLDNK